MRISDRVPVDVTEAVEVGEPLIVLVAPGDLVGGVDTEEVRDPKTERLADPDAVLVLDTLLLLLTVAVKLLVLVPNTLFDTDMVPVLDFDAKDAVFDMLRRGEEESLADFV